MQQGITPLNYLTFIKNNADLGIKSIDNDFFICDNIKIMPSFTYPFRTDATIFIINLKGETRGKIGLHSYHTVAPCIITILSDEIMQYENISEDFEGLFIMMSKQMTDLISAEISEKVQLSLSIRQNPSSPLSHENLKFLKTYYGILKAVTEMTEVENRREIVKHLMMAFYYHSNSWLRAVPQQAPIVGRQEEITQAFLETIPKHYKKERQTAFYADILNITPKYLSQLIKQRTGKSANEWIDDYVILEAKTLLKSSKLTIQQIADELNFADQSAFGKYFKRLTNISPKGYRNL